MEIKKKDGLFVIKADSKTSKGGNDYISVGIGHSRKNQSGEYETTWFNMFPEDLLKLSSLCENTYHSIIEAKNNEYTLDKSNNATEAKNDLDEIPF